MATYSLQSIKSATMAKDNEEKRKDNRDKAMLLFAFQLLLDKGYLDTANSLASECSLHLEQYNICENIDLNSIFVEFETYYNIRFGRYPQYFRKSSPANSTENLQGKLRKQNGVAGRKTSATINGRGACNPSNESYAQSGQTSAKLNQKSPEMDRVSESDFIIQGCSNAPMPCSAMVKEPVNERCWNEKLLKPISSLDFGVEDGRMFAEMLQKEIIFENMGTRWDDVVGLEDAKMILQESLILAKEFQQFFGSALPPWRGLMLYGPPGTGKTLLAKAVATECKTTFFNISTASIVSKWRGDSEKIVKILFDLARFHAPSTIFLDEFDALGSRRDCGETDAARRLKSEILQQMDGIMSYNNKDKGEKTVFVLTATNLPWDVDAAMLRRFEKRIYIPLPGLEERKEMFHMNFSKISATVAQESKNKSIAYQVDLDKLAGLTEGYSGSDISQITKETLIAKFRQYFSQNPKKLVVSTDDVASVIEAVTPTCNSELLQRYQDWEKRNKRCLH